MGGSRLDVGVLLPRVAAGVGWGGGAGWRRGRIVADRSRGAGAAGEVKVAKLWDPDGDTGLLIEVYTCRNVV